MGASSFGLRGCIRRLLDDCQARLARRLLLLIGQHLFRLRLEFRGLELVPRGEPLLLAVAPHRNWIDPFLVVMALPPLPRVSFLGSQEGMFNRWWKRLAVGLLGGVVPISTAGGLNRAGLARALAVLEAGSSLGLMPEGWDQEAKPADTVQPIKRGVAFLAERSGRRVVPIGLAGTQELWRGKVLRLCAGRPLDSPPRGASKEDQADFAERVQRALESALPALPDEPVGGSKPWPWLTRLLY